MTPDATAEHHASLAVTYGTPLYVYDLDRVRRAADDLTGTLPSPSTLLYSLKANPHPDLVRELLARGARPEISSSGELAAAIEAGGSPSEFFYTGPGKTAEEIALAIDAGVRTFSVESPRDLHRVAAVARTRAVVVDALLRVNGSEAAGGAGMRMTGEASQFGTDVEVLRARREELHGPEVEGVRLAGFHFYPLTNASDEDVLVAELLGSVALAAALEDEIGVEVRVLDLGGGFGCPFARPGERPAYPGLRAKLEAGLDERFPGWRDGAPQVYFESGRHLVGDAGTLLTAVSDVKTSRDTRFAVLDSGIHHLGGLSGIGRLLPLSAVPTLVTGPDVDDGATAQPTKLVGPLCTPADTLGRGAPDLPPLESGDILAVPNVGAYGATASLLGFLSRPGAAEVVVRGGTVVSASRLTLVRASVEPRQTASDDIGAGPEAVVPEAALVDTVSGPAIGDVTVGRPWDDRFVPVLVEVLPRLAEQSALEPGSSLRSVGLDSLAMVDLLVRLEEEYGVSIPDDALDRDAFDTPGSLWQVLEGARRSG
ncbi:phosphopantetheine-binding protein [Actinomycetospora flava]|uniref:Phosphopantetheine-binding protein n=1 Tax=Actinomycetospora flava TaxID=3129232 RepID=A0ABU8M6S5_9PSEU